jgi:hypothetical protein
MGKHMSNESNALVVPPEIARIVKRPKLVVTESREDYDALFDSVAQTIVPTNSLEWIATGNYVEMRWEIWRLRRAKAAIVNMTRYEAFRTIFESVLPETEDRLAVAARLAQDWYEKPDERTAILDLLGKYDLDDDAISAQALALRSPEIEKIDRMMQQLEISSMAQLREIEFHRRASSWRTPESLMPAVEEGAGPLRLQAPGSEQHIEGTH